MFCFKKLAGTDHLGNTYYVHSALNSDGRQKRSVKYNKSFTSISPEWDAWLRYVVDDVSDYVPKSISQPIPYLMRKDTTVNLGYKRWKP